MNRSQRFVVLSRLAAELRTRGSWCGETHLQKSTFLLQELTGVETGYDFILYKHGPFSFDLRTEVNEMIAAGLFEVEQRYPYGPSLVPTDGAVNLESRFKKTVHNSNAQVTFVADTVGDSDVFDLERLATALYLRRKEPQLKTREIGERLHDLKPHISLELATEAIERVQQLDQQAPLASQKE